ncbi:MULTISPECIES: helix-turn-helix domain-containing protein [Mesorhizobium]|uniref:helix-turn-helix domain-containing protein n=1 Tax=Mesorhizobium TaxID=68287 RepID=UPI0010A968BA|nr:MULTISPECIES: helix-turn-helix domain-containing protein [Mesorhizobium]
MTGQADPQLEVYVASVEAAIADLRRYVEQRDQESCPLPTQQAETRTDDLIETSAAASRFRIADDTVRLWCRQKKVFGVKDGGRWLVSASALRAKLRTG